MSERTSFTGRVTPGRGLGAPRMAEPAVLAAIEAIAGFPVVPGTLNVVLDRPFGRPTGTLSVTRDDLPADLVAETGQLGYHLTPIIIAGRFRGLAMQADEEGYPLEQVELISEVRLRNTLELRDDDLLHFSVAEPTDSPGDQA